MSENKEDLRLVYLAIHHIIKYRGNFLYPGDFSINSVSEILPKLETIIKFVIKEDIVLVDLQSIFDILKDKHLYKKEKIEKINNLFNNDNEIKKKIKSVFKLIVGMKEELSIVFDIPDKKSLRLSDDYDESEIENMLGEDIEYFNNIKDINSWYLLQDILKGSNYISEAFIFRYNKFSEDLNLLKSVYKRYLPNKYDKMFRNNEDKVCNFNNYNNKKCKLEDLYKQINNDLKEIDEFDEKEKILLDIQNEDFVVKLNNRENGAIPYQLHKLELEKILNNQAKYYPFLNENKEKILKILTFRIPYYVGPLHNDENQPNNWSIRKEGMENVQVLPWNFDDVIDKDASANEFIRRMTNKCTYLPTEDVIPKKSLLYSEYCVLNELNNIRCDGKQLSIEQKQLAIEKLFKERKTIKEKRFKELLTLDNHKEILEIRGFQKEDEFASNLESFIDFTKILGKVDENNYEMVEQIIEWITVFEDKDILERKLRNIYGNIINEEQMVKICKLNYSGWSRLSKKLLVELRYENEYGKRLNIMDILRNTNYNFMQIITDKDYGFDEQIKKHQKNIENKTINSKFYEDNIATIPGSPANKRGIWQTLKIVNEIVKIIGKEPQNIFVEFAREDAESKRTNSRRNKLQKAYEKFCDENTSEINKSIKNDLKSIKNDIPDRLYLYYSQNGKCMYSGKPLDIDKLELYQIDHIIPQSKIKDDSIDNRVLVYSIENQKKLDGFIDNKIIDSQKLLWKKLFESGLISQVKYFNLLNNKDSDKRTEGFMKRQLVETRQITKYVTNILQNIYEDSNIFAIKATLGHDFREKYDILKIREMNDYHHAHDAYINSVIGIYINKKYPKLLKEFIYSDYIKEFNKETIWSKNNKNKKYGFIISNMGNEYLDSTTGEIISNEQSQKEIVNIKKQLLIRDIFITKKLEEQTGAFYNQNALSKNASESKKENAIPIKEGLDTLKYGSYSGEISAFSVLFEYEQKGKKHFKIIGIPIKERNKIILGTTTIEEYIKEIYGENINNIEIINKKILKNQLLYKEGNPYYFVSSGEIKICKQLFLNKKEQELLYIVLNGVKNIKTKLLLNAYKFMKLDIMNNEYNVVEEYIETDIDKSDIQKEKYYNNRKGLAELIYERAIILVYDILTEKIKKEYFETIGKKLETYKENMLALEKEEQIKVIKLLLIITSGIAIDLKSVGGKSGQGRLHGQNMNEKWLENVTFINQSVTGMFEKRFKINELEDSNCI